MTVQEFADPEQPGEGYVYRVAEGTVSRPPPGSRGSGGRVDHGVPDRGVSWRWLHASNPKTAAYRSASHAAGPGSGVLPAHLSKTHQPLCGIVWGFQ